jgi:hypothetical protein
MQHRRAFRLQERGVLVAEKADDRFRPCRRIARIATGIAPQDGAGFIRKFARKGSVDADESVSNEQLYLIVA